MARPLLDPDSALADDPSYWAAALLLAIRANDQEREEKTRRQLARLGFQIVRTRPDAGDCGSRFGGSRHGR